MSLFIYIPLVTNRHRYIFGYVFREYWGIEATITEQANALSDKPFINYSGENLEGGLKILPYGLLEDKVMRAGIRESVLYQDIPCICPTPENNSAFPFDPFSMAFFMLTRYEEYTDSKRDAHGRTLPDNALAYKLGVFQTPWLERMLGEVKKVLAHSFPGLRFRRRTFEFTPTFDIDVPYAFLGRSLLKRLAGAFRLIRDDSWKSRQVLTLREKVLSGKERDPFDTYDWIRRVHEEATGDPVFFFLMSGTGAHNTALNPRKPPYNDLIRELSGNYEVGLHPSYGHSEDPLILSKEKDLLEEITGRPVTKSRNHFLRQEWPATLLQLEALGIVQDYSMGYASLCGFRAGISRAFPLYDLKNERQTGIWIQPFACMESTYKYYREDMGREAILEELLSLVTAVKDVNGHFVSLFHNDAFTDFGNEQDWKGIYQELLRAIT